MDFKPKGFLRLPSSGRFEHLLQLSASSSRVLGNAITAATIIAAATIINAEGVA